MIVFDLSCAANHRFEGWFSSSDDYDSQLERGLVSCPECGSPRVSKAPMAPAIAMKGNQTRVDAPFPEQPQGGGQAATANSAGDAGSEEPSNLPMLPESHAGPEQQVLTRGPLPEEVSKALENLANVQKKALEKSKWVGSNFVEQSRAMHYGERDAEVIHGKASVEEAEELMDEGIHVAPLPFPIASPEDVN